MPALDVLIDTAGFLSLWDATDEYHQRAVQLQADLNRKARRFLTTDYIVDETATPLWVRHSHEAAADFLETVSAGLGNRPLGLRILLSLCVSTDCHSTSESSL